MGNIGTALVTGASAGIGRELARVFADKGHDLILVARRKKELDALAESLSAEHAVDVSVQATDLSVAGAVDSLFGTLAGRQVDFLVNNAGVLSGGYFLKMDQQAIDNMIRVNILALTELCHRFMAPMLVRGSGRVVNVASIAAFQPVPSLAVYAATKAYVLSLSEALAVESERTGVSVTAVCPGFTDTDMLHGMDGDESGIPDLAVLSPRAVARDAYAACMAGEAIKVPGVGYALTTVVAGLLPRWVLRRLGSLVIHTRR